MNSDLIKDNFQLDSTKLIRGGTDYSPILFELKLQLHGQVSNPYTFSIKENYKTDSEVSVAFTSQTWTTPGTYTWTAPFTGTATICVIGGGGGSGYCRVGANSSSSGGTGGSSQFKLNSTIIIQATGGTGGKGDAYESDPDTNNSIAGSGGSPNGRPGNVTSEHGSSKKGTCSGGQGFALSKTISNGSYGKGADITVHSFGASGGSGGRNQLSYQVTKDISYIIVVGSGGTAGRDGRGSAGNSGAVGIWKE